RIAEDRRGADHLVVVVEGLALALEDRARDAARRVVAHGDERGDHLPRGEVPRQPEPPGRAEVAAHRAADLRRGTNAEAALLVERDPHRLGERSVRRSEEVLDEVVEGIGDPVDELETLAIEERVDRAEDL